MNSDDHSVLANTVARWPTQNLNETTRLSIITNRQQTLIFPGRKKRRVQEKLETF